MGNKAEQQGIQRERRVRETRNKSSSRGNKRKKSKWEQGRAAGEKKEK